VSLFNWLLLLMVYAPLVPLILKLAWTALPSTTGRLTESAGAA